MTFGALVAEAARMGCSLHLSPHFDAFGNPWLYVHMVPQSGPVRVHDFMVDGDRLVTIASCEGRPAAAVPAEAAARKAA